MPTQRQWDTRFLNIAREVRTWSKDPIYRHGCVAVNDRKIISTGYNGFPAGSDDSIMHDRERKRAIVIHAEENCIYNCVLPEKLRGSVFYISGFMIHDDYINKEGGLTPCAHCASAMLQVGVTRIVMSRLALESIIKYQDQAPYFLESTMGRLRESINGILVDFV